MKKFTTKILYKGKEKTIAAWINDETAKLLEAYGDERLKHKYIIEEYKAQLIERRETRRHQSLEKSIEGGHEFIDEMANVAEIVEGQEEISELNKALTILTKKQLYVLKLHVLAQKSFREISEEMGLNLYTVYEHYTAAKKKLKKFFS